MEFGVHGISTRIGDRVVGVHSGVRRGGEAGSRVRGKPVLDRDANDPLLLLNGALRNAARGRGPRREIAQ